MRSVKNSINSPTKALIVTPPIIKDTNTTKRAKSDVRMVQGGPLLHKKDLEKSPQVDR
jgi:hypothetical protein